MIRRTIFCWWGLVLAWSGTVLAAQEGEKLLENRSLAIPWVVGAGILVVTLIAGFKHPGRTHLD